MLLDTSVLIDYLRSRDATLWGLVQANRCVVCGVVRAEILAGARNARDQARLKTILDSQGQLPTSELRWDSVGDNVALLRSQGVSVPLADMLLATLAIEQNIELWTRDAHFILMQRVLPALRLYQEPP